jgi:hypothetical protein
VIRQAHLMPPNIEEQMDKWMDNAIDPEPIAVRIDPVRRLS